MAHPKACFRLGLMLLGLLLLSGCAGKPLIEREIVRAIFFAHSGGDTRATLVLQDQQKEEADAYQTVHGTGKNARSGVDGCGPESGRNRFLRSHGHGGAAAGYRL